MLQELARATRAGRFWSISQGTQADVALRRLCGCQRSENLAVARGIEPAVAQSLKFDEPAATKIDRRLQEHTAQPALQAKERQREGKNH
jgi:hypothetical protein